MDKKTGRNDPCPCGSGKKFKQCCWKKHQPGQIKFTAKKIDPKKSEQPIDLLERTFGRSIATAVDKEKPPTPSAPFQKEEKEKEAKDS